MDLVVQPEMRKWISEKSHLGQTTKRLRLEADVTDAVLIRAETNLQADLVPFTEMKPSTSFEHNLKLNLSTNIKIDPMEVKKSSVEIARIVNEFIGGDKFFDVKTKKTSGKRKSKKQTETISSENFLVKPTEDADQVEKMEVDDLIDEENSRPPSVKDFFTDVSSDEPGDEFEDLFDKSCYVENMVNRYWDDPHSNSDDSDSEFNNIGAIGGFKPLEYETHDVNESDDDSITEENNEKKNSSTKAKTTEIFAKDDPKANASLIEHAHSPKNFVNFTERVSKIRKLKGKTFAERKRDVLKTRMSAGDPQFEQLQRVANPTLSSSKGDSFKENPVVEGSTMPTLVPPFTKESLAKMQTLDIFMTHGDDPTDFQWRSNNVQQQINYDMLNIAFQKRMKQQKQDYEELDLSLLVNKTSDLLIEITVYKSNDPDESLPDDVKVFQEPKIAYKLEMIGHQTIADLRNVLICENDLMCVQEIEHPDNYNENKSFLAKNKCSSAMILIDDVIYCDMHSLNAIDYATRINEWANTNPKKKIGPFKSGDMHATKLKNLTIQFGYPYVYIHLDNCEHVIVFNKARLFENFDEHRLSHYPRIIKSSYIKNLYCRVDNELMAKWAVLDYNEFPENPMLICTECLKEYCYKADGTKRGTFRLYPFRQLANEL